MNIRCNDDVIDMYEQGYSLKYIVKKYFDYKNRDDVQNHYFKGNYIITSKKYSMSFCEKAVCDILIKHNNRLNHSGANAQQRA